MRVLTDWRKTENFWFARQPGECCPSLSVTGFKGVSVPGGLSLSTRVSFRGEREVPILAVVVYLSSRLVVSTLCLL